MIRQTAACPEADRPEPLERLRLHRPQQGSLCMLPSRTTSTRWPTPRPDRPPDQLPHAAMPVNPPSIPIDPRPTAERRIQPGADAARPGARPRQPGGPAPRPTPSLTNHRRLQRARSARRGHQHDHRQAPPDLGRARLHASRPAVHRADDPPAGQLRSGHRYVVAMRDLKDSAGKTLPAPRASATTATPAHQPGRDQPAPLASRTSSTTLAEPGIKRSTSTWPGTSPPPATRTTRPGRSDAGPGLRDPRRHDRATAWSRARARVHRRLGRRRTSDPRIARRIKGTYEVPCYLIPSCAAGRHHEPRTRRDADAKRHLDRQLRVHRPARDAVRRSEPGDRRRPAIYGHGLIGRHRR